MGCVAATHSVEDIFVSKINHPTKHITRYSNTVTALMESIPGDRLIGLRASIEGLGSVSRNSVFAEVGNKYQKRSRV